LPGLVVGQQVQEGGEVYDDRLVGFARGRPQAGALGQDPADGYGMRVELRGRFAVQSAVLW